MSIFLENSLPNSVAITLSPRLLAHLGDSVLHLFEREREILSAASAKQLHQKAASRVSAVKQADYLDHISSRLSTAEQDLVRRARNLKPSSYKKIGQNAYRKATAFEALIGYLYLTDIPRLKDLLSWTLEISS